MRHKTPAFVGNGRIEMVEAVRPDPGPGELRLRVQANAICGSDRAQFFAGSAVVPGHETAGTVEAVGPDTTTPVGTRGVVFLMDYCGTCRSCRLGATNQCLQKRADMGFTADGGLGPYEIVHESNFFPVTDDVEITTAILLLDVLGTSGHALGRAQVVRPDIESIYIAGAGPIGLGLVLTVRLRLGADLPVYISDLSPWRLEFAESFGATPVRTTDETGLDRLGSVDVAFDASGRESARRIALDRIGRRGVLICVGHGEGLTLDVSRDLLAPERAVLGSEYFRYDELPGNLDLLRRHQDVLGRVITHRFGVDDLAEAFRLFLSGETGKVVIVQEDP